MATRKRNVEIEFLVDDKQATKSLKNVEKSVKTLEGQVTKTGETFSKAAKWMGGLAVGRAISGFAQDSIRAFSDLEQSVGGTQAVFGDASDAVDNFAKRSASSIGMAESEFRTATTLIGGQLKRMTGDVDFASEQSIVLAQTAADLAATYGGTTVEAVEALSAAFRGEANPAERFNLNLMVSKVNAKAVEMGLAKTVLKVDEYAKAQALLALIAEQSADAQGQFGREADTAAGKLQRLTAKVEDQKAAIGERLLPVYGEALETFSQVADELGLLTGSATRSEIALRDLMAVGQATSDTAVSFANAFKIASDAMNDWWGQRDPKAVHAFRTELESLWQSMELGREETAELANLSLPELIAMFGLTQAQAEYMAEFFNTKLAQTFTDTETNLREGKMTWQQYAGAIEETTAASDDFMGAQLALASPVLAAVRATLQAEEAQRKMNAAILKYGDNSPEAIEATLSYVEAMAKADGAAAAFADEGGPAAIQAFENAAREAGISEEVISAVIEALERLNKIPAPKNPFVNYPKGTPWLPTGGFPNPNLPAFADGGVVPGPKGAPVLAKVHGGEVIFNEDQQKALKGMGGGSTVVNFNALSLSDRQLKEIQEMARRS